MRIDGAYTFDAPIERVWDILLDPASLSRCIPGCEKLEPVGPDEYAAVLKVGAAMVRGTYSGRVRIDEKEPPRRYRLSLEGSGALGSIRGEGIVLLEAHGRQTLVKVTGEAEAGGAIGGIAQRLLGGVARTIFNQFFACLQHRV